MGLFSSIAKIAAPIIGGAVGGPVGASIGGAIAGGLASSDAAKRAADAQANAAASAAGVQRYMYDTTRADMAPYRDVGASAINQLRDLGGLGDAGAREEALNQFYRDPGYQFRLDEGTRAIENSMLARGKGLSGTTGRALTDYGQGVASQEYGNYWNRLSNLAGIGQTTTGQLGGLGANAAANIGNANIAAGQARGSGYIGQGDALANTISNVTGAMGYGGLPNWFSNWGTTNYNPPTVSNPNANPIYTPWGGR